MSERCLSTVRALKPSRYAISLDINPFATNATEDPRVLENLLGNYRRESEEVLSAVEQFEAADHPRARALLHQLKGSTGSLGFKGAFTIIAKEADEKGVRTFSEIVGSVPEIRRSTNQAFAEIALRYPNLKIDPVSDDADVTPDQSNKV
jgi:hypothetical protein